MDASKQVFAETQLVIMGYSGFRIFVNVSVHVGLGINVKGSVVSMRVFTFSLFTGCAYSLGVAHMF